MRMVRKVMAEKEQVYEIVCNMCGESIKKSPQGEFFDHLSINKNWDYLSSKDGEAHQFDLCENCYDDFIKNFKIKCF